MRERVASVSANLAVRRDNDLPNSRHHAVTFLRTYRVDVIDEHIPLERRRLAIYRRAALQALWNVDACQRRLEKARKPETTRRWQEAIATWKEVGAYFNARINALGERF